MKKQVKAILLPQTDVKDYTFGNILKSDYRIRVSDGGLPDDDAWEEPCHLYIVNESSPIVSDMWSKLSVGTIFIRAGNNRRKGKWEALHELGCLENKQRAYDPSGYQILATTNPELIVNGIPAISQEFIREYVQVQGQGVVYMEFENWIVDRTKYFAGLSDSTEYKPKLDNAGNIILKIVSSICNYTTQEHIDNFKALDVPFDSNKAFTMTKLDKSDFVKKETVNPIVADAIRTVPDFGKEGKSNIPEDQRAAYMLAMENIIAGKESIRNLDVMREMFLAGWNANPAKYTEQEFIEANQRHWQLGHDAATSMKGFFEGKWTDEHMYQIMKHGLIISPGYNRDSNIDEDYWRKEANQWLKQKQENGTT